MTHTLSPKDLEELQTLLAAVTPGPWSALSPAAWDPTGQWVIPGVALCGVGELSEANALVIAALHNAAPALLALASQSLEREAEVRLAAIECHKLDTEHRVLFYENDFYVLSNFSAFTLQWNGNRFDTSEAAYHWEKFRHMPDLRRRIQRADSAHEAFKIAEENRDVRRLGWDDIKIDIMRNILRAKADQHEYVRRKLLKTGERELVEDSWRDDFWGWGPNRDGKNMLGKLWTEIRSEYRALAQQPPAKEGA